MKLSDFFDNLGSTLKSIVKILIYSRRCTISKIHKRRTLVILANGPSLNTTISESFDVLRTEDTMTVNFAPATPVFNDLRPKYHILADPLFFTKEKPFNVAELYRHLEKVDWKLTLLVPHKNKKDLPAEVLANRHITVSTFNFIGLEGFDSFERFAFRHRLGMPRPRNVLIPAIMCGIWAG